MAGGAAIGGLNAVLALDTGPFAAGAQDAQSQLASFQARMNTSLAAIDRGATQAFDKISTRLLSVRNLAGPLLASFSAGSIIAFGENIASNFAMIEESAKEAGIAVDQALVVQMQDAVQRSSAAWTRLQVAAAPYVAMIEQATAATLEFGQSLSSLDLAQLAIGGLAGAGGLGAKLALGGGKTPPAQNFDQYFQDKASAGINGFYAQSAKQAKDDADAMDEFAAKRAELINKSIEDDTKAAKAQREIDQANYTATNDMREKILKERYDIQAAANETETANTIQGQEDMQAAWDRYYEGEVNSLEQFHKDADEAWSRYYEKQTEQADREARHIHDQIVSGLSSDFTSFIDNVVTGKESFGRALAEMAESVAKLIVQLEVAKAVRSALDEDSGGGGLGGIGGAIGKLFGFGGGVAVNDAALPAVSLSLADIGLAANGAYANAGDPFIIGEQGPELFVPGSSGRIVPNGQFGGGDINVTIVQHINGNGDAALAQVTRSAALSAVATVKQQFPSMLSDTQMRFG